MVADFDAVFGTRRGSPEAQAQRDAAEEEVRARALKTFIWTLALTEERYDVATALADTWIGYVQDREVGMGSRYVQGKTVPAPSYEQLVETLVTQIREAGADATLAAVAEGDPADTPGLTAPAIEALGRYFASPAADTKAAQDLGIASIEAFHTCSPRRLTPLEHYEQLRPLCEGLGVYLGSNLEEAQIGFLRADIFVATAKALSFAPTDALRGPLRSWIEAVAAREREGVLEPATREILRALIRVRATDVGFDEAFAPLRDSDRARERRPKAYTPLMSTITAKLRQPTGGASAQKPQSGGEATGNA